MIRADLFEYVLNKYGTTPEYLWSRFPNYAVLRHSSNNKWYAAAMDVPAEKLNLPGSERIDILNVKVNPDDGLALRLADDIMPAYHMNKKNWISIVLDGSVPDELIRELIEESHKLTA